jgi:hypothetical protein
VLDGMRFEQRLERSRGSCEQAAMKSIMPGKKKRFSATVYLWLNRAFLCE